LGSGAVSFTHVIKSAEPIFSAILSAIIYGNYFPFEIYLSLFPIVMGVGLASAEELSFTWISFISAMASNLFYQLRIVLAKKEMTNNNIKSDRIYIPIFWTNLQIHPGFSSQKRNYEILSYRNN
jgi:solute carrier family 35 protein E1